FTSGYTLPPNAWDWNSFRTISGDFNGDGRADVAAMYHFSTGAISMCTSLADTNGLLGSFNCSLNIPASAGWNWSAIRLFAGDANGDGRADAIMEYHFSDNSIQLFTSLGDTNGGFGAFTGSYKLPANAWDWNAFRSIPGDFNGDGRADLAVMYHYSTGAISMCTSLADASGGFGPFNCSLNIPASAGWNWSAIRLYSGDANGDAHADAIMEYHYSDNSIQLFTSLGDTNGGFGAYTGSYKLPANAWDWNAYRSAVGDVNGDSRADMVAGYHFPSGSLGLCTSQADANGLFGSYTMSVSVPVASTWTWRAV
ncbi:MAG TPA: VCBS repeat-containing protein, partial [Micromonosporaceae bacterium]